MRSEVTGSQKVRDRSMGCDRKRRYVVTKETVRGMCLDTSSLLQANLVTYLFSTVTHYIPGIYVATFTFLPGVQGMWGPSLYRNVLTCLSHCNVCLSHFIHVFTCLSHFIHVFTCLTHCKINLLVYHILYLYLYVYHTVTCILYISH